MHVKLKVVVIGVAAMVTASVVSAQSGFVPAQKPIMLVQLVTPDIYRSLPLESRQTYVAGVLDAESDFLPQAFASIKDCVKGAPLEKLTAIVDRGFAAMSPLAIGAMPQNVHNALVMECQKR
jgi:hypothetical protein